MTRPPILIDQLDPREPPHEPQGPFDGLIFALALIALVAVDWRVADGVSHLIHHHRF